MAKLLTSWLVPNFSQPNMHVVVLGRCSLVVVIKFQDKFASLRQLNSPNNQDKFQICCIAMYYFVKISSESHGIWHGLVAFAEFRSSTLNIRRQADTMSCVIYIIQTGDQKFASGDYISPVGRQNATWGFF